MNTETIRASRLWTQSELGLHWLHCGWRQFCRNPWLLGGMGVTCAVLTTPLSLIPLVGAPVIALLMPIFLASAYLALDAMTRQKLPLPAALRMAAVKQSPQELLGVFRNEERMIPMLLLSVYSLTIVLAIDVLALLMTGNAWSKPWASLDVLPLLAVVGTVLFVLAAHLLLAASLIYALPLAFLQDRPLIPAIQQSFGAGAHYLFALLVVLAFLLAPLAIGALVSYVGFWLGIAVRLVLNAIVWPVVVASLYCSYRTVFSASAPVR